MQQNLSNEDMKKLITLLLTTVICCSMAAKNKQEKGSWVATWATATEFTGKGDMPKSGTLTNKAIRQIVRVSIGGETLRLHLSNEYSKQPVEIRSIYIANLDNDPGRNPVAPENIPNIGQKINVKSAKYLKFDGKKNITIPAGKTVVSDALAYHLEPLQRLAITVSDADTPENATSHRGSRTTSYIIGGEANPKSDFTKNPEREDHWYNIATIDVMREGCEAIAVIGNSITDGRGTTTNLQDRWTDFLADCLQANDETKHISVLNLGIGGNAVYFGGLSDPAYKRFDRDILGQDGVKTVIVFEGINDLGGTNGDAEKRAKKIIECYKEFIAKAHSRGMKIYGATISPYFKSFYDNGDPFREAARQYVNKWIRESKAFDGVLDFDAVVRDPQMPSVVLEKYQMDWLHLNPAGYEALGRYSFYELRRQ